MEQEGIISLWLASADTSSILDDYLDFRPNADPCNPNPAKSYFTQDFNIYWFNEDYAVAEQVSSNQDIIKFCESLIEGDKIIDLISVFKSKGSGITENCVIVLYNFSVVSQEVSL